MLEFKAKTTKREKPEKNSIEGVIRNLIKLQMILNTYGSFAAHRQKKLAKLTAKEYQAKYGLTQKQYNENTLPPIAQSISNLPKTTTPHTVVKRPQSKNNLLAKILVGVTALLLLASSLPYSIALMNPAVVGLLLFTCVVAMTVLFWESMSNTVPKKTQSVQSLGKSLEDGHSIDFGLSKSFAPQLRAYQQKNTQSAMEHAGASKMDALSLDNNPKKYKR